MKRPRDPLEPLAPKKKIPFAWVLDELAPLDPVTRPMFGSTAVYARGKIVFCLREKGKDADDGVWVATTRDHHESLRGELPSLRLISVFGNGETGWQVLSSQGDAFEDEVMRACALVRANDPRIGKVTKATKAKATPPKKTPSKKRAAKPAPRARSSRSRRAP